MLSAPPTYLVIGVRKIAQSHHGRPGAGPDARLKPRANWTRIRRAIGWLAALTALPFFLWLPLGWLGLVPSMVDVFGVTGLRIPASIVVGSLLVAAIGFHEF